MREKLIEAIREVPISKTYEEYVEALADRLDRLKISADKWISVEDRLPDPSEYDWVLGAVMTTELPEGFNWYLPPHVVENRNGEWWAMGEEFSLKDLHCRVTHWMPLPELPKEYAE